MRPLAAKWLRRRKPKRATEDPGWPGNDRLTDPFRKYAWRWNPAQKTGDKYGDLKRRLFCSGRIDRLPHRHPCAGAGHQCIRARRISSRSRRHSWFVQRVSGGALQRFSILALGIMPYISASIIMQLASVVVPSLEALKKEGGRSSQDHPVHRYGTLVLAFFRTMGIAIALESQPVW